MFGLKRKVKLWRESFMSGANNTGNVSATVSGKPVLSWNGTPTQKDDALKLFPVIQQRIMPGVSPESFADAVIASIHDEGMAPGNEARNIQTIAMLWRLFTTPVDHNAPGFTFGDLVAVKNFHVAFELHEQPNEQFKVTWTVNTMPGDSHQSRLDRPIWRMGPIRRAVNLVLALALAGASAFSLIYLLFYAHSFQLWMPVMSGLMLFIGLYWFRTDYINADPTAIDDEVYAERIYQALVDHELGDFTPEKMRIPPSLETRYRDKTLLYREACALASIAAVANDTRLRGVMKALVRLVQAKRSNRGIGSSSPDELMYSAIDSMEDLFTDPFKWSQRWLREFRSDPEDNYMVVLFADHWQRQFNAVKEAIDSTRPK